MLRRVMIAAVVLMVAASAWAQEKQPIESDGMVTVEVTGAGTSKEDAIKDAKRKAVEKGAGTFIYSHSKTEDFVLVKDTILTRAAGFLHGYKEIGKAKESADGVWEVKISADVSIQGVKDTWAVVQNLLKDMGRPKLLVVVKERVDGKAVEMSTVQTKIEGILKESGFALVDKDQLKEIDKKDLQAALAEDKPDKVQAIAKRFGAQVFIYGTADAQRGNDKEIGGVDVATYEAQSNVKVFKSDTAEIETSVTGDTDNPARGVQQVPLSAAKQALAAEAGVVAAKVQDKLIENWAQYLQGGGEVQLHVDNIKFGQVKKLKAELAKIKGVNEVNPPDFHNNTAECTLQTTMTAKDLAEKLDATMGKMLEISDVTQSVIKAKFVGE